MKKQRENFIYVYDLPLDILELLSKATHIGIDTEALGLNVKRDRLCLVQITDFINIYMVHFPTAVYNTSPNLTTLLNNEKIEKIFHFARFDVGIIFNYLNVMCQNVVCTKMMSKISRTYTERHGLKELCSKLLNIELNKNNCCSYWGGALDQGQIKYAGDDVIHLLDLKNKLMQMLILEHRWDLAVLSFSIIPMIVTCDVNNFDPVLIINHH
jgi:ribonuclease D